MLKVKFTNYINDFAQYREEKCFSSLDGLKEYLKKEVEKRCPNKSSVWWKNPCNAYTDDKGIVCGWFRANRRNKQTYSLWLDEIKTADNVIVFEAEHYCSPKIGEFLRDLHGEFEIKPVYGDL